ncbi:MAG: hypothetical protein LUC87_01170 [Clostridiales bacterium]|nr:hypothetical protein [Clostridiales bacterium]
MKRRRQFIFIGVFCAALLLLSGCGRVATGNDLPSHSVSAALPSSDASVSSDVPPEAEPEENPYRISGLTLTEETVDSANGDVVQLGRLAQDAETEEGYFTLSQLYDLSNGKLAALYSLSDGQINISEGDAWDVANVKEYLAIYDWETGQVERTVALPEASEINFSYVEQSGNLLWSWTQHSDGTLSALCYDDGLNLVTELECSGELFGCVTEDGAWLYYVEDGALLRRATDGSGEGTAVSLQRHFSISYLDGIFSGKDGAQYAILYGMAGDLQYYDAVVNLDTGEFLYLRETGAATLYADNGVLVASTSSLEENDTAYTVFTGQEAATYTWSQEEAISLEVLADRQLLFYETEWSEEGSTVRLGLYDQEHNPVSSTSFSVEEQYVWLCGTPVLLPEEDALLIPIQGDSLALYFYRWDYVTGAGGMEGLEVSEAVYADPMIADVTESWDPAYFQPQECPEELADLRAEADALEEQYGLTIYISDECRNFLGSYAITALSDHDTVAYALEILEEELAKYPEGFFRQFECQWLEGIELYLAGSIIGIGDGVLDYAGGLQTTSDSHIVLAVDCCSPEDLRTALHHEISHAIEVRLLFSDTGGVDEAVWNELNPSSQQFGDCYTYSYETFGYEEFYGFVYDLTTSKDVYFIDTYSLTFPTEDRARLFENVMSDSSTVDWAACPNLRAKLNYYAECIRAGFDTTGWEEVPWEAWLEEDTLEEDALNGAA